MEEQILVIRTELFHRIGHFQGFCRDVERYQKELLAQENILFMPRSAAEQDPSYKQLIPYLIFCNTPPNGEQQLFRYIRGKGAGESRLRSKQSIGVGGHLSLVDANSHDIYREGLNRELNEEIDVQTEYTEQCVGLINDDSSDVGRVHLGIVHLFHVKEPKIYSKEPDLIESGFVSVSELLSDLSGFESWSAICLEALFLENKTL